MNQKTLKLTTGAMCAAIFGMLLLLNRQTGQMLQEMFLFLFPIPMVAYSARYGWKDSLLLLAAMAFLSVFLGTFTTIFYAVSQALIGLIFGQCLHAQVDMTKTLFVVMALSAGICLVDSIVLAGLFGADLNTQIAEMQTAMDEAMDQVSAILPQNQDSMKSLQQLQSLLGTDYLRRILIISMAFSGLIQGFLVYEISLLVLKRLRFPVMRPKSVYLYYPPKWSGAAALVLFYFYTYTTMCPLTNSLLQNIIQTAGICGYLYLLCFGWIGMLLFFHVRFPGIGALRILLCVLLFFLSPVVVLVFGAVYIMSSLHGNWANEYFSGKASQ